MLLSQSFNAAKVMSFGPVPSGFRFDAVTIHLATADGSSSAALVISASLMRRQILVAGQVAASADFPLIAPSSQVFTYTFVATNVSPGPSQSIRMAAAQPLPKMSELWLNIELETVTNARGVVCVELAVDDDEFIR